MNYRCRLGSVGNFTHPLLASDSSDRWGTVGPATVKPSGRLLFVPAVREKKTYSILTLLLLPSSFVSASYIILALPIRMCSAVHLCMSSTLSIAILNGEEKWPLLLAEASHIKN